MCLDKAIGKILVNRHVVFNETCFPFSKSTSLSNVDSSESPSMSIIVVRAMFSVATTFPEFIPPVSESPFTSDLSPPPPPGFTPILSSSSSQSVALVPSTST